MTQAEELANFVTQASYDDLSPAAREQLKTRVLDSLGCAIAAVEGEPVAIIRAQIHEFDSGGKCALIGGGQAAPDRAAFYNGALVRYLDFNDSYLAKGETCHPSDSLGAILAATEYAGGTGRDLMLALAVAYQVQCRLSDVAPVRDSGFDHTTQGAYAVGSGVAKALRLDRMQTANAIGICGTAFNGLRVTRTGRLSHWKGLAASNMSACCTQAVFLARAGLTGPIEVFEGEKGFMDAIAGVFEIRWTDENLERVNRTILKKYNAEIHSQTAIQCVLELKRQYPFVPTEVRQVDVDIFDVAYRIIGGGEEGDKTVVLTKEQADHSLPYIVAVTLLDGEPMPEQYSPERIHRDDVQHLLRQVFIRPNAAYSERFPEEMPCSVQIHLSDGRVLRHEACNYPGFLSNPMSWDMALRKFDRLAEPYTSPQLRQKMADALAKLEEIPVSGLTRLFEGVKIPAAAHLGNRGPQIVRDTR